MTYTLKNDIRISQRMLNSMEQCGLSESEIAGAFGISRQGLYKIRCKMNWKQKGRSDKGVIRVPLETQRERWNTYQRERYHSGLNPKYDNIRIGKKTVQAHRYFMEQKIGRALKAREVVHHIDGNSKNNELNNLYLCGSQKEHFNIHFREKICITE